jgi:hypothetical protein
MDDMLLTLIEVTTSDNNDGGVMDRMLLTLIGAIAPDNDEEEHCKTKLPAPVYPEPPVITTDASLAPGNTGSQQHSAQNSVEKHQKRCINTVVSLSAATTGPKHHSIHNWTFLGRMSVCVK